MEAENPFEAYDQECNSLKKEDEELIEHLRAKYSKERQLSASGTENAMAPMHPEPGKEKSHSLRAGQANSMKSRFTICSTCQGSGRKTEIYNFRVLESDCATCHGECIVDTSPGGGVEGKENEAVGESQQQCICLRCRKTGSEDAMFCCSRCKTAVYCGKDCQAKDWSNHRLACRRART